jgi:hypothetical protein
MRYRILCGQSTPVEGAWLTGIFGAHFGGIDYREVGETTRNAIYRGDGNSEVNQLVRQYIPDL